MPLILGRGQWCLPESFSLYHMCITRKCTSWSLTGTRFGLILAPGCLLGSLIPGPLSQINLFPRIYRTYSLLRLGMLARTFTLDNMETYFRNYIPCTMHSQEPITNFCLQSKCLKAMCPQCVEQHSKDFQTHKVESIRSCISRSSSRLSNAIQSLSQRQLHSLEEYRSPQQYAAQHFKQLRILRDHIVRHIDQLFLSYQQKIRTELDVKWRSVKDLKQANSMLRQAIKELQLLQQNLFNTNTTLETNRKVNQIDFPSLLSHIESQIKQAKSKIDLNLNIEIDQQISQKITRAVAQMIEVQSNNKSNPAQRGRSGGRQSPDKVVPYNPIDFKKQPPLQASIYPTRMSPTKDKRVIQINTDNSFQSGKQFLHFFQTSSRNLHVFPLQDVERGAKWVVIKLNIKFDIPVFHKSTHVTNGRMYVLGGSWQNQKLARIFMYENKSLVQVGNLLCPRSSHSIATVGPNIFVVGGFTTEGVITSQCEIFDTKSCKSIKIANAKRPCSSPSLVSFNNSCLFKIGGTLEDSSNCRVIQRYDIKRDVWQLIDPIFNNYQGEFELLSTGTAVQINSNQIFVFGGYNQQNNNQASDLSYLIEVGNQSYQLKDINLRSLPIAQGFWNPNPVILNNRLFCLQNVTDQGSQNCVQDRRNVLMFDGKNWTVIQ